MIGLRLQNIRKRETRIKRLVFLLFFTLTKGIFAQDTSSSNRFNHAIIPVAFYLPETSLGFGVTSIFTFNTKNFLDTLRPSQVVIGAAYTLKNQVLFYIPYRIFTNQERNLFNGELGFYKYFFNFYGIGTSSKLENQEVYNVIFPRIDFRYGRLVRSQTYLGLGYKFDYFNITNIKEQGLLNGVSPTGVFGGVKSNFLVFGIWDKRDHVINTKKGFYAELLYEKSVSFLGSDFKYSKMVIDLRKFLSVKNNSVIAFQGLFTRASDGAPFFDLPYIGSPNMGRGMNDRRYLGYTVLSAQAEWRYSLLKRLGLIMFSSIHQVSDQTMSLFSERQLYAGGVGFRYTIDQVNQTQIRLDIGTSEKNINFYITVNQAF